jgi:hypothetical protein
MKAATMLDDIIRIGKLTPTIVRLGSVKIGGVGEQRTAVSGAAYRRPEKYDHFRIVGAHRDDTGNYVRDIELEKAIAAEYGDPLRRIPIAFLGNELEDILTTRYVWYGGKRCAAWSDGQIVTWYNDPNSGRALPTPLTEEVSTEHLARTDSKGNRLFRLYSVLSFIIAAQSARWGGVYQFRTSSVISFQRLYASISHLRQLTGGVLAGFPMVLAMDPITVSPEGRAITVYVVHVELLGRDMQEIGDRALRVMEYRVQFRDRLDAAERQYRALLAPPGAESEQEAADIAEEFAPEEGADAADEGMEALLSDHTEEIAQ